MNIRRLKHPMDNDEVKGLLQVHELPSFLAESIAYRSKILSDFYIGFNRIAIGEPISTSYKAIVKNLVVISKEVTIPVKRNGVEYKEWDFKDLPEKVVIIVNVREEFFTIKNLEQVNYNLIGVFDKEDFMEQYIERREYDEFTSFLEDEEREEVVEDGQIE